LCSARQIAIEKAEGVWRSYHAHARFALLLDDLIPKRTHSGPMNLWPKVVFGVVAVVEPDPIIKLVIAADAQAIGSSGFPP
jgi:hypothetical protein